jgi:hypothetical protein
MSFLPFYSTVDASGVTREYNTMYTGRTEVGRNIGDKAVRKGNYINEGEMAKSTN